MMGGLEKFPKMVVFIILTFVVAAIFLAVMIQIKFTGEGEVGASRCRWGREVFYDWNGLMNNYQDKAEDAEEEFGIDLWPWEGGEWYPGKILTGDPVGDGLGALGDALIGLKMETDPCIEYLEATCMGPGESVARCLYMKATLTFYTLDGGKDRVREDFNLFMIKVEITKDGKIQIKTSKSCADLTGGQDGMTCNVDGNYKNITFDKLSERAIVLSMLAKCQESGVEYPGCMCFVKTTDGYTPKNGLPHCAAYTQGINLGGGYGGCGCVPATNTLEGVVIPQKALSFDLGDGEDGTYYTRIVGGKAKISESKE